jgi:hypothetical protein
MMFCAITVSQHRAEGKEEEEKIEDDKVKCLS